jgi:DNA-directed RNA polymerase subunit RPC12/RpoP
VISVEYTMKRGTVQLDWACRQCAHRWPVVESDRILTRPKPDPKPGPTGPTITGLVCPSCRKPVAVIEDETVSALLMTCPECGHRWTADEPGPPTD